MFGELSSDSKWCELLLRGRLVTSRDGPGAMLFMASVAEFTRVVPPFWGKRFFGTGALSREAWDVVPSELVVLARRLRIDVDRDTALGDISLSASGTASSVIDSFGVQVHLPPWLQQQVSASQCVRWPASELG